MKSWTGWRIAGVVACGLLAGVGFLVASFAAAVARCGLFGCGCSSWGACRPPEELAAVGWYVAAGLVATVAVAPLPWSGRARAVAASVVAVLVCGGAWFLVTTNGVLGGRPLGHLVLLLVTTGPAMVAFAMTLIPRHRETNTQEPDPNA